MFMILRPRNGVLRWHSYGFAEPEDVVQAMMDGYLEGLQEVRQIDFNHFVGWTHQDGWRAAGYLDVSQRIARLYLRCVTWEDREINTGCRDFVDRHYDAQDVTARPTPHLVPAAR